MNKKTVVIACLLSWALIGCGGGGEDSASLSERPAAKLLPSATISASAASAASSGMFFPGAYAGYAISKAGSGYVVKNNANGTSTTVGENIRRLKFDDKFVALDIDGTAGQIYRLYQAAFARTPDQDGLGYHIAAIETSGLTLEQLSVNFINSPEFAARYGHLSSTEFVTQLYAQALHRAPDPDGLTFHVGNIESGKLTRAQVLIGFSESPENQKHVLPAIQDGIAYMPFLDATGPTSYLNYKSIGLAPHTLPRPGPDTLARAYADFSGRGVADLFTATGTYNPANPISQATPSRFEFWRRQDNGTYTLDTTLLASGAGCIHPRKAIVADFNNDGRPDVFVACHGYDAPPFPGERNKIVLSQPNGGYVIQDPSDDVGFFHGASAADLNSDGLIDVMVVNNFDPDSAFVLVNQGNGTFKRETTKRLPSSIGWKPYFSVELVDVNEDGRLDLVLGGHEYSGAPTVVFINPGKNNFSGVTPVVLPAVANEGVVLDFTVTGTGSTRALWLARSSGGDGSFYASRVIQRVSWPSLASSIKLNQRPAQWVPWLIPAVVKGQSVMTTDNAADSISVSLD